MSMTISYRSISGRVWRGVSAHFDTRVSEWALASIIFGWGVTLLTPGETFAISPSYLGLARLASENVWGVICLAIGAARLIALTLNGTFSDTPYSRWSPHVRAFTASICVFIWFQITLTIAITTKSALSTGLINYCVLLGLDCWNVRRAVLDSADVDWLKKK